MKDMNQSNGTNANAAIQEISSNVAAKIKSVANTDADLLEILTRHIMIPSPDADAVEKATTDIKNLAEKRATS